MRERCDSWMRARVRKCAQGFATVVAIATAFAVHADFTVIDSAAALDAGGASGGDIVRRVDSGVDTYDIVHIFTNTTAAQTFTVPARNHIVPNSFQVLVVGGGGSGGSDCGGGGGAGGYLALTSTLAPGTYSVIVGAGGGGWTNDGSNHHGENGSPSVITNVSAGAEVALALGGGGHEAAAATTLRLPVPEAKAAALQAIDEEMKCHS